MLAYLVGTSASLALQSETGSIVSCSWMSVREKSQRSWTLLVVEEEYKRRGGEGEGREKRAKPYTSSRTRIGEHENDNAQSIQDG